MKYKLLLIENFTAYTSSNRTEKTITIVQITEFDRCYTKLSNLFL